MLTRGPILGLNHVLAQHAWARQRLMPHAGCMVQFQLPPLPDLSLYITEAGLVQAAAADAVPNLLINIRPAAVPLILAHHPAMLNDIEITGSPELVQVIRQLFSELEWDFEEDLSKVFGDIAAHRLARPELSQGENEAIYGKCARPHGHGHNYLLDVTVRGSIDPRTGMVCDLAVLQQLVDDLVVEPFDHTFLNKDVAFFATCVPTAENIALHIADLLTAPIAATGARLHKVRVQESPNNAAEVFAESPQLEMVPAALEALVAG